MVYTVKLNVSVPNKEWLYTLTSGYINQWNSMHTEIQFNCITFEVIWHYNVLSICSFGHSILQLLILIYFCEYERYLCYISKNHSKKKSLETVNIWVSWASRGEWITFPADVFFKVLLACYSYHLRSLNGKKKVENIAKECL